MTVQIQVTTRLKVGWRFSLQMNGTFPGPYPTVVKTEAGNTVLIVQAMSFTKYLGHIKVKVIFGAITMSIIQGEIH